MASEVAVIDAHGRHAQAVRFTGDGKLLSRSARICGYASDSVPDFCGPHFRRAQEQVIPCRSPAMTAARERLEAGGPI